MNSSKPRKRGTPIVDVVVRCRNEMPHTERALAALARQRAVDARVLFIDCESTDGSREVAHRYGAKIVDMSPSAYIPGMVLNLGMHATEADLVAFINADAIPLGDHSLLSLIEPLLDDETVAATYARQLARPSAASLVRTDYARAFPSDAAPPMRNGAFFSMAASAVRRKAWDTLCFDEALTYSEDVDWTTRIAALGWTVKYAPEARFEHSHDYDLRGHFLRRRGEGLADTSIHRLGAPSPVTELARPWLGMIWRDVQSGAVSARSLLTRSVQALGYFQGRRAART